MDAELSKKNRAAFTAILDRIPGNSAACQRARMLAAMRQFEEVTTLEAMRFLDVYDPRPRVYELRREGYWIRTTYAMQPTESGVVHAVGAYSLAEHNSALTRPSRNEGWMQMALPWSPASLEGWVASAPA
ncbi:helix-turn-helix domain-containing protein [Trinickia mobilis]|uniref:helix-turn-helix domain-containing protein n=1 Tax=Trinickia mobilis TaxID=2816356 RepID=UPI001A8D1941|nr:helix-turn-helix domain-containing protein [Trinickia mobilis]